jgi:hypothetical protein
MFSYSVFRIPYSVLLVLVFSSTCLAESASSSTDLINNAKYLDGKEVTYIGEAIGDVMRRGDFSWVNVNDDQNAIGIWTPNNLAAEIKNTGSYQSRGDVVEVTGILMRACPEHGADLDIHAKALAIIKTGGTVKEKINPGKVRQAAILLGALCLVWILTLFKRK